MHSLQPRPDCITGYHFFCIIRHPFFFAHFALHETPPNLVTSILMPCLSKHSRLAVDEFVFCGLKVLVRAAVVFSVISFLITSSVQAFSFEAARHIILKTHKITANALLRLNAQMRAAEVFSINSFLVASICQAFSFVAVNHLKSIWIG